MKNKFSFREPLSFDKNGLYITAGQMQFFLNTPGNEQKFSEGSDEFYDYYYKCGVYNLIWDMIEIDDDCAYMYWDEEEAAVAYKFPDNGEVAQELVNCGINWVLKDEDAED